ncbi:hypothetical protein EMPS_10739 [Entomortierella parvispora]|uniref:Uncharacterized protein n=1 Tax=Entomortierella parvispora TaxID=205924 RepID=A0A9P3HKR1_9FUNG|nr:hypothetical protein EMPS_10739 [Entomortierella parvispora]
MAMVKLVPSGTTELLQSFQWPTGGIRKARAVFDPETGKHVVYLRKILRSSSFGQVYIQDDNDVVIELLEDENQKELDPARFEYLPNTILKISPIVQHLAVEHCATDSTALVASQSDQSTLMTTDSVTQFLQVFVSTQLANLAHDVKEVKEAQYIVIDNQKKNHAAMVEMLSRLDAKANYLFRLTVEIHEYPIPRLFVILPGRRSLKDKCDPISKNYRLYFLCECDLGEDGNEKQPLHFTDHKGYDLQRATEFCKKYGPYMLAMLQLVRIAMGATSFVVPHIAGIGEGLVQDGIKAVGNLLKDQLVEKITESANHLMTLSSEKDTRIAQLSSSMHSNGQCDNVTV